MVKGLAMAMVLAAAAATAMVVHSFAANGCAGNACDAVSVAWVNGCYSVRNNGQRTARVTFPIPSVMVRSISRPLAAGEAWVPQMPFTSDCMKMYESPYQANYE